MNTSEHVDLLAEALAKAQALFPTIPKNRTATVEMKAGGKYSYTYADLADVREATKATLAEHGLAVVQLPAWDGRDLLVTRLMHASGQWVEATMRVPDAGATPQGLGSGLTYARRYAYAAVLGLVTDDDDDGQAAAKKAAPRKQAARKESAEPAWLTPFVIKVREFADANGYDPDRLRHAIVAHATDGQRASAKEVVDTDRLPLQQVYKALVAGDLVPADNGQVITLEPRQ